MSSLNTSMYSNYGAMNSNFTQSSIKKSKNDLKSYLINWSSFYKDFDEDRFTKAQLCPVITSASVLNVSRTNSFSVDRRFIGIIYAWIERYFLTFQQRTVISICNDVYSHANNEEKEKIQKARDYLLYMLETFKAVADSNFSFPEFVRLHEDLLYLIGWKKYNEPVDNEQIALVDSFVVFAIIFYRQKLQDSFNVYDPTNSKNIYEFLDKFDKDKALQVSEWIKMPIKVLVQKQDKIQLLCDKNGAKNSKELFTKVDKAIILVEEFQTGQVHIGYDSCIERIFRFSVQCLSIINQDATQESSIKYLTYQNSMLSQQLQSDCWLARQEHESLTSQLIREIASMKLMFENLSTSWLKTLGLIKNYILPDITMFERKKQAFLDALDVQTEVIGDATRELGIPTEQLEAIFQKYYQKHEHALEEAIQISNLKQTIEPKQQAENLQVLSRKAPTYSNLEQLIYGDGSNDTSKWTIKHVIEESRQNITKMECSICCDSKKSNEFWFANCSHVYCIECLKEHINSRVQEGKRAFSELTCCMCELMLEPKELYAILPQKTKAKIDDFYANRILNFTCPNEKCGKQSNVNEKMLVLNEGFITNCCGQHVCSKCKAKFHESARCPSQTKELIESIEVFRQTQDSDASRMFRFCPVCSQLAFKDAGCNHVKCIKCKTEFCFQCSAPRMPILGHGNHYHRKGCPDFAEYIHQKTKKPVDLELDIKKCGACAKTKKPCKRPQEWNDFNETILKSIGQEVFDSFPDNFIL